MVFVRNSPIFVVNDFYMFTEFYIMLTESCSYTDTSSYFYQYKYSHKIVTTINLRSIPSTIFPIWKILFYFSPFYSRLFIMQYESFMNTSLQSCLKIFSDIQRIKKFLKYQNIFNMLIFHKLSWTVGMKLNYGWKCLYFSRFTIHIVYDNS